MFEQRYTVYSLGLTWDKTVAQLIHPVKKMSIDCARASICIQASPWFLVLSHQSHHSLYPPFNFTEMIRELICDNIIEVNFFSLSHIVSAYRFCISIYAIYMSCNAIWSSIPYSFLSSSLWQPVWGKNWTFTCTSTSFTGVKKWKSWSHISILKAS